MDSTLIGRVNCNSIWELNYCGEKQMKIKGVDNGSTTVISHGMTHAIPKSVYHSVHFEIWRIP